MIEYKKKNILISTVILVLGLLIGACDDGKEEEIITPEEIDHAVLVTKTNKMKVYMHYMPWFHSKDHSGYWGIHWKMANKNPDVMFGDQREIASHYYPLIGPYDSSDPDVIDYHLLLMKYAGIDGVLIDWYGSHNINDYGTNLSNSNALISRIDTTGLQFAVVYEEFTAEKVGIRKSITAVEAAQADMNYLKDEYFDRRRYIKIADQPLLMTFGPRYFKSATQWTEIFSTLTTMPKFLPLWNHGNYVGENSSGEFSWVDFDLSYKALKSFYGKKGQFDVLMGSAYPGFNDFYKQGGWGDSYGNVSSLDGYTMTGSMKAAKDANLDYLQLVTWNDFGEGTMIEPTVETGFKYLMLIQDFTGVEYGEVELQLIHDYYLKRKAFADNATVNAKLDEVFRHLNELNPVAAQAILTSIEL